jgi:phosphoglycolate phosphatase
MTIRNNIRLLIFDWDGTLMDSEAHIVASIQHAMQTMDLDIQSRDQIKNVIGLGMREAIFTLFHEHVGEDFIEQFIDGYRQHFFKEDNPQQLFPDARETLESLSEQGYLLAVATGKSRRGLNMALAETGLASLFHSSRCADETRSKPHPVMLQEILEELSITSSEAIMIGDTEYDLEMAQKAGTFSIAANYGVHEPARLLKYNPLATIDTVTELQDIRSILDDDKNSQYQTR